MNYQKKNLNSETQNGGVNLFINFYHFNSRWNNAAKISVFLYIASNHIKKFHRFTLAKNWDKSREECSQDKIEHKGKQLKITSLPLNKFWVIKFQKIY